MKKERKKWRKKIEKKSMKGQKEENIYNREDRV